MTRLNTRRGRTALLGALVSISMLAGFGTHLSYAADHGDAPNVANDQGCDIADVFLFLDPNDNSKVFLGATFRGFISASENANFGQFDPNVRYRFEIQSTNGAKPDGFIDVTFSRKTQKTVAQTATIVLPSGKSFSAPCTLATVGATAPAQVVTTDAASGAVFFAGLVDDPFFFDVPAFARFLASVEAGAPNASFFSRGRDTFAGYNILSIALEVPKEMLLAKSGTTSAIGVDFLTQRGAQGINSHGDPVRTGGYRTIDRMGNPAVNTALIPFAKKSSYNASSTRDDIKGKFAPDIVNSLHEFGTDDDHISVLASVAVNKGDMLRLSLGIANSGGGGGDNASAGYPNGRRLKDDTIDTILTLVNNGNTLTDNVSASDVPPQSAFPFFALPHQPLASGTDDGTRN